MRLAEFMAYCAFVMSGTMAGTMVGILAAIRITHQVSQLDFKYQIIFFAFSVLRTRPIL